MVHQNSNQRNPEVILLCKKVDLTGLLNGRSRGIPTMSLLKPEANPSLRDKYEATTKKNVSANTDLIIITSGPGKWAVLKLRRCMSALAACMQSNFNINVFAVSSYAN
jgi:hypothetical protein